MNRKAPVKLLTLDLEILKHITGGIGFPGPLGTGATLRTATVSCQCPGGPGSPPPDVA